MSEERKKFRETVILYLADYNKDLGLQRMGFWETFWCYLINSTEDKR